MIAMTVSVILCTGLDSPSVGFKELLENEKNNFRLVNTAVAFLGGVPAMINPADMSNTIPNEKVREHNSLCSGLSKQCPHLYVPFLLLMCHTGKANFKFRNLLYCW